MKHFLTSLLLVSAVYADQDTHFIVMPSMVAWQPPVEKEYVFSDARVKKVHHTWQGGRHVCIEDCKAPTKQQETVAEEEVEVVENASATEEGQEFVEQYVEATYVSISASVYFEGDKPFTLIRLRCGEDKVEAWSSMNFAELVTGVSHYKARGIEYYSFVGHGIDRTNSASSVGCPVNRDKLNQEKARFLVIGERHEECTALEAMRGLHKLYNQEREGLQAAYLVRVENQRKAEEWRKANPPKPKDITIRFWKND